MGLIGKANTAPPQLLDDLQAVNERQRRFHGVRPDSATLFLTYRCNSRCRTCTFWKRDHKVEKKTEMNQTVDPAGNLIACPFINNYMMGNVLDKGLPAVWNNEKHQRFRELQNCGELEMRRHCILGAQRNPGFFTQLKRIYYRRIDDALARI